MTARGRVAVLATALLAAVTAGCGQTGSLVLPESAQPIDPGAASAEPEQPDDERQDER
jgi:predicted small lipoprotein YifL